MFARSAVKPLQALGSVRAGVLERFGLGQRHLALACASHGGTAAHVEVVAQVLAACGLVEGALGCGPELPLTRVPHAACGRRGFSTTARASTRSAWRAASPRTGRSTATSAAGTGCSGDARLRRRGVRRLGDVRGGDRRLRDAHVRGPAGRARARVRRSGERRPRACGRPLRRRDARASGARRLRRRDRHGADARRDRAGGEDRRRGSAGGRARRRPRAGAQGPRRRRARGRSRGRRTRPRRARLDARVPEALAVAPILNSRGLRVGELRVG